MKIKDIENTEKYFIIRIHNDVCEAKGFNPQFVGGRTHPNIHCLWWQKLENHHEIRLNRYWAKRIIEDYNLTDDDIELDFPKMITINVKRRSYCCCGKKVTIPSFTTKAVRICPHTRRALMPEEDEYDSYSDYEYEIV